METIRDLGFEPDARVQVTDGPFKDFVGVVYEVDHERRKVRIKISFFGKPTSIELDLLQIKKV